MNRGEEMTAASKSQRALRVAGGPSGPVEELLGYLAVLHGWLKELAALAGEKMAAIRSADAAALQRCTSREEELIKQVFSAQRERGALVARAAQSLPLPEGSAVSLMQIAEKLPEPLASSLQARSVALREVTAELHRKNRLVAEVARNLQSHIRGIFAHVAKAAQESVVYGAGGQPETSSTRSWVDAVG